MVIREPDKDFFRLMGIRQGITERIISPPSINEVYARGLDNIISEAPHLQLFYSEGQWYSSAANPLSKLEFEHYMDEEKTVVRLKAHLYGIDNIDHSDLTEINGKLKFIRMAGAFTKSDESYLEEITNFEKRVVREQLRDIHIRIGRKEALYFDLLRYSTNDSELLPLKRQFLDRYTKLISEVME